MHLDTDLVVLILLIYITTYIFCQSYKDFTSFFIVSNTLSMYTIILISKYLPSILSRYLFHLTKQVSLNLRRYFEMIVPYVFYTFTRVSNVLFEESVFPYYQITIIPYLNNSLSASTEIISKYLFPLTKKK